MKPERSRANEGTTGSGASALLLAGTHGSALEPGAEGPRRNFQEMFGPLLTTAVVIGLVSATWNQINVIYLPVVLLLAVAFSTYVGGFRPGFISAGLAWVYLTFFLFAGPLSASARLLNWLVWTAVLPVVVLITGFLQRRARVREFQPWAGNVEPFRLAAESVPDLAVVLLERAGKVTSWNTGAQHIFGWSAAERAGRDLTECFDPLAALGGAPETQLETAAEKGRGEAELDCRRKDGTRFRAKLAVLALRDERGQVAGYTVSFQDLSERQQAASVLLRRTHQQMAVAALSQTALVTTDLQVLLDHAVMFITQTWAVDYCAVFELQADGHSLLLRAGAGWKEGLVGQLTVAVTPGSMMEYALQSAEPVIVKDLATITRFEVPEFLKEHGVTSGITLVVPGAKGKMFGLLSVHSRSVCEFTEEDLGFLLAVGSVLATAQARTQTEAQLRQSQKMEAIGQLASGVAHDFNNILTIMQGQAARLLARSPRDDQREELEQILNATERAAGLTKQLLAFSRKQNLQPRLLDLRDTVASMMRMLERLIGENISLQVKKPSALPAVSADPSMMEQIVLNLAVNARDAMPDGGKLILETCRVEVDEAYTQQQPLARLGSFVALKVTDTGCGMDPATLARIFEPFFTTKGPGQGTGLGLATVYGIVQQHEGWIEVKSEVGRGTTFSILLPATDGQVEAAPAESAASDAPRGGPETILVVEDEALLRELAGAILQELGYTVLQASTGLEALVLWKKHRDQIHLVLTDMVMPGGLTGRDLAERLRSDRPELKMIFSSGYSADVAGPEIAENKSSRFLQKPYRPALLAKAVRDCLDAK